MHDLPRGARGTKESHVVQRLALPRDDQLVARGKDALESVMRRALVPTEEQFWVCLASGEALANALLYGLGDTVRMLLTARPEEVRLVYIYETEPFDTTPALPDPLAERGRGIPLMRELCQTADWRFLGGGVILTLARSW